MAIAKLTHMSDEEFRWLVGHTGRITQPAFETTIAVLAAVAFACFIGRLFIRGFTRRRLYLDDAILIVAVGFLCATIISFYKNSFLFFLINATVNFPELKFTAAFQPYAELLRTNQPRRNIFAFFNWTAIYAVKFCFFAFFKGLIENFRALTIWYWFSVAFSIASWIAAATSGWILTMYANKPQAAAALKYNPNTAFTYSTAILDIVSDLMIISIPILLLRNSSMKFATKMGIGAFLSLSIFMIICVVIRMAGFKTNGRPPQSTWRVFWQITEACVAVMMASLTALRILLVAKKNSSNNDSESRKQWARWRPGAWSWVRSKKRSAESSSKKTPRTSDYIEMPNIPSATLTGMRTHIRRNGRGDQSTTIAESVFDPSEADYHNNLRKSAGPSKVPQAPRTRL